MNNLNLKHDYSDEEKALKNKRQNNFRKDIMNNYYHTFVKSLEKAVSNRFKMDIELIPGEIPGTVKEVLHNGKPVEKDIEKEIKKYIALKKKAYEKNSDYYFKERGEPIKNQKENLRHRSLGEETIFNY